MQFTQMHAFSGDYALQDAADGRRTEEPISRLLLWRPKHGKRKADRPSITYTDLSQQDTGLERPEVRTAMLYTGVWRAITLRAQVLT